MKIYETVLLAIVATFSPLVARSEDAETGLTPMTDRLLSDPSYLPLRGDIVGQSEVGYGRNTGGDFDLDTGDRKGFNRGRTDYYAQRLIYGITDWFSVSVGETYQASTDYSTSVGQAENRTEAHGFVNPTFGAAFRLIDERSHPFNLDLTGSYLPDVFAARSGSAVADGAKGSGGDAEEVGMAISREMRLFTIQAGFAATHYGARTIYEAGMSGSTSISENWSPFATLSTQIRLTNRFSVNLVGQYYFRGNFSYTSAPSDFSARVAEGNYGVVDIGFNYEIIQDKLVGTLGYTHSFYGRSDTFASDPARDTFSEESGNNFSVALMYRFGRTSGPAPPPSQPASPPPPPAAPPPPALPPEPSAPPSYSPRAYVVYFPFDSFVITPDAQRVLQDAAKYALDGRASKEVIVGHTDSSGSATYNLRLSERRAKATADALVAFGVPRSTLDVSWTGKARLAVPTPDGVREPLNRRTEIDVDF